MNNKDLHDAIGEIDTSLIADVAEARKTAKSRRFSAALKYVSVAACVCLVVLVSVLVGMGVFKGSEPDANIPAEDTFATSADTTTPSGSGDAVTKEPVRDISETSPNSVKNDVADEPAEDMFVPANSNDLTSGVMADKLSNNSTNPADFSITVADFSFELFRNTITGNGNEMLSPLSALYALTMCANSVEGESLRQIENAVGLTRDEMNDFVSAYMDALPNGDGYSLKCANSLWLKDTDRLWVSDEYLSNIKEYLSAQVFSAPFDNTTVEDINNWVSHNTDGMIDSLIDSIDLDTYAYLINTIAFDAKWRESLNKSPERPFFPENVTRIYCNSFMHGNTSDGYLEDDDTIGFILKYKRYFTPESLNMKDSYAFVLLLPNKDISISDYINSLSGEKIHSLLQNKQELKVNFHFPGFESSYEGDLKDVFKSLGITDIFEPTTINQTAFNVNGAPLYYSKAIHKTFIKVNTGGTKAAAVSALVSTPTSTEPIIKDKEINVNRPFVYMIVDCENGIPLFIGTMMEPTT